MYLLERLVPLGQVYLSRDDTKWLIDEHFSKSVRLLNCYLTGDIGGLQITRKCGQFEIIAGGR